MDSRIVAALIIVGALAGCATWYVARPFMLWRRLTRDRVMTGPEEDGPSPTSRIDDALAVISSSASRFSASALVKAWAKGRACAACGGEVAEPRFTGHHIALLEPNGMTRQWVDKAADCLPLALATSLPLCWNCHVAATFRRTHPELVTDREERTVHVSAM